MTARDNVVFLLDCDNTLLGNDLVQDDLRDHLAREFGPASRDEYWAILERLRSELGYADYLGALQRYRLGDLSDTRLLLMSTYLVDYPFASRLYPGALDPHNLAAHPAADLTVERIGDLATCDPGLIRDTGFVPVDCGPLRIATGTAPRQALP
jgi:hypothetical protein